MRNFSHAVVTGGAGFLGSDLCDRLLSAGTRVTCLDNFLTGAPDNVEHLQSNEAFRLIRTDVTDFIRIRGPVDRVLHFASPASPVDYLRLPIETMKVGSIGTLPGRSHSACDGMIGPLSPARGGWHSPAGQPRSASALPDPVGHRYASSLLAVLPPELVGPRDQVQDHSWNDR